MNKAEIIDHMCKTFRNDYDLEISEDDRMYTLTPGMTKDERETLHNSMKQIFENVIMPIFEKHNIIID